MNVATCQVDHSQLSLRFCHLFTAASFEKRFEVVFGQTMVQAGVDVSKYCQKTSHFTADLSFVTKLDSCTFLCFPGFCSPTEPHCLEPSDW